MNNVDACFAIFGEFSASPADRQWTHAGSPQNVSAGLPCPTIKFFNDDDENRSRRLRKGQGAAPWVKKFADEKERSERFKGHL